MLIYIYFRHRYAFTKPSIMIVGCYHILYQWPIVFLSAFLENFLPSPWHLALLVHGFILLGIAISFVGFNQPATTIWESLPKQQLNAFVPRQILSAVFAIALMLSAIYLYYVPFTRTGLYALLYNPTYAAEAREFSLKLLDNPIPKYALTLLSNTIAPLFTACVTHFVLLNKRPSILEKVFWSALLGVCWTMAIFNGAKGILAFLAFTALGTMAWNYRLRLSFKWIIAGVSVIMVPAVIVTLLLATVDQKFASLPQTTYSLPSTADSGPSPAAVSSKEIPTSPRPQIASKTVLCARRFEAKEITNELTEARKQVIPGIATSNEALKQSIPGIPPSEPIDEPAIPRRELKARDFFTQTLETSKRSFVLPMVVAAWYVDYVQHNGSIGIAGIPRLASVLHINPIDLPNRIGVIYAPCYYGHEVMDTINATTGFVFAQYGYFGLLALPLSLLGLLICDVLLLIIRNLPSQWLAPTLAIISLDALKLTQSDFLTIWITHGLAINLVLIVLVAHWRTQTRTTVPELP